MRQGLDRVERRAATRAVLLTAVLFLALPYVHLVAPSPTPTHDLVSIRRVTLPEPPQLPVPAREEPLTEASKFHVRAWSRPPRHSRH